MLLRIIAKIWVLKSEQVLISEGVEVTPMYHLRTRTHARTCIDEAMAVVKVN